MPMRVPVQVIPQLLMLGRQAPGSQPLCLHLWTPGSGGSVHSALLLSAGIFCNGTFDRFVCWPHSSPGNVSVPCPSYLPWWREGNVSFYRFLTVSSKAGPSWEDCQGAVRESTPIKCFSQVFSHQRFPSKLLEIHVPSSLCFFLLSSCNSSLPGCPVNKMVLFSLTW